MTAWTLLCASLVFKSRIFGELSWPRSIFLEHPSCSATTIPGIDSIRGDRTRHRRRPIGPDASHRRARLLRRRLFARGGRALQKHIKVEVVIAALDEQHCTKFRNNLEFWRQADRSLLGPGPGCLSEKGTRNGLIYFLFGCRVHFDGRL